MVISTDEEGDAALYSLHNVFMGGSQMANTEKEHYISTLQKCFSQLSIYYNNGQKSDSIQQGSSQLIDQCLNAIASFLFDSCGFDLVILDELLSSDHKLATMNQKQIEYKSNLMNKILKLISEGMVIGIRVVFLYFVEHSILHS